MKTRKRIFSLLIVGAVISALISCYSRPMGGKAEAALKASGSAGADENNEGVSHFEQGHLDVAKGHFDKALAADPNLAETHYNLGLVYDGMGDHDKASQEFKRAAELAPNNPKIAQSEILKKHTGGTAQEAAPAAPEEKG
jgi:Tfp pilus assembly protein PilF